MNADKKLRNSLIRKIQLLSLEKLSEVTVLLNDFENKFKSKKQTLKLAGTWRHLDDDFFSPLTEQLISERAKDRKIE